MYSTCIFCNRPLGTNSTLASFPVGRRVAFDAAKGRLWVICRRCERWNLSPLDERWEAVEEAERLYHDTRRRVATAERRRRNAIDADDAYDLLDDVGLALDVGPPRRRGDLHHVPVAAGGRLHHGRPLRD